VSGLLVAVRYLTIVSVPGPVGTPAGALGRAAAWFPVVGAALGVALLVVDHALARLFPGLLVALLTVTVWKVLTGGLHLDGLADCLDALGGRTPEQRRVILRDSRIGTFGAVGLILFLMIEIVALAGMAPDVRWRALLAAPAIGRATPPVLARLFSAARLEGQGAGFAAHVGRLAAAGAVAIALAVALVALREAGAAGVVAGFAAALAAARFLGRRLDGITGDVMGAGVELAELAALLTVAG
jgi:adenosylcobinamide-GDP ribazoletransferase